MCWKVFLSRVLLMVGMWLCLQPGGTRAEYKSLQNDRGVNTVGLARVLVAPSRPQVALRIVRIRMTSSDSTVNPSYVFASNNSSQTEGETSDLTSCALPTCQILVAIEAAQEGTIYDYDDLGFRLMALARGSFRLSSCFFKPSAMVPMASFHLARSIVLQSGQKTAFIRFHPEP